MPPEQKQQSREEFIESLFVLKKKDNFYSEKEARDKLMAGVQKGVDAIKGSYGAAGSNSVLEHDLQPFHIVTNDGKIILDALKLADPVENIGLEILKEITAKSDKESGDGRKTSVILAGAILKEGLKAKGTPMEIKRSLDECLEPILDSITENTKQITEKEIGKVAAISSESEELGDIFQEIYKKIGKNGIVEIDNSNLPETFWSTTEGVKLRNCGYHYPYMCNEDKGRKAVYKNPKVLITKQKISTLVELDPIFKELSERGINELVIFCDEIDPSVSQGIAMVHMQGIFKCLVIKSPTLWKDWLFEDFAKITGAQIINPPEGRSLKSFRLDYLGSCGKIICSKDETVVLETKDISQHLQNLKEKGDDDSKLRLAWLQTKTAILKLGANSETELSYKRGKAADARNASFLALQEGVVAGGGVALLDATEKLPKTVGGDILRKALRAPINQILENMEAKKGMKVEPGIFSFGADILDPALVVKNAIRNALSVASSILTTRLVITKK